MKEEEILREIFGEKNDFKYCDLCESFYTLCSLCKKASCSGGGCQECVDIVVDTKLRMVDYLNDDESKTFWKISRLKRLMRESLNEGELSINWIKLKEEGKLSKVDEEMFAEFLN